MRNIPTQATILPDISFFSLFSADREDLRYLKASTLFSSTFHIHPFYCFPVFCFWSVHIKKSVFVLLISPLFVFQCRSPFFQTVFYLVFWLPRPTTSLYITAYGVPSISLCQHIKYNVEEDEDLMQLHSNSKTVCYICTPHSRLDIAIHFFNQYYMLFLSSCLGIQP